MGLIQKQNRLYLKAKLGALYQWNGKENIKHKGYEGVLVGMRERMDSINDMPQLQFEIQLKDPESDQVAVISWAAGTYLTTTFFPKLVDLDLSQPFTFSVWAGNVVKGQHPPTYANVYQNGKEVGKFVKGVEQYPDFPKPTRRKKATGGTETDWDGVIEHVRGIIKEYNDTHGVSTKRGETVVVDEEDENIPF